MRFFFGKEGTYKCILDVFLKITLGCILDVFWMFIYAVN